MPGIRLERQLQLVEQSEAFLLGFAWSSFRLLFWVALSGLVLILVVWVCFVGSFLGWLFVVCFVFGHLLCFATKNNNGGNVTCFTFPAQPQNSTSQ